MVETMSIISNEHQSGSPFDREPESSEPGCICGRGVRCPLHGGPPQPGPEPMTTERQPGSPGVDLDALERRLELDLGSWGNLNTYRRVLAELRTLRARVEELECAEAELEAQLAEHKSQFANAVEVIRHADRRVVDLEAQLAAAREEQGLEAKVREVLGERFFQVRIARYHEFWQAEWREVVRGETLERFADAETLPALLRAILAVEAKG